MTRFSINYEEPSQGKPPPSPWVALRVFMWTLLLACVCLWAWTMLAA